MLLDGIKTILNKYNGIMDGLSQKKEIFGDLKEDYIAMYKMLTEHEDFAKEDYNMHIYHIGDFDGVCHLLISADTDYIQYEITRGTYHIKSPNGDNTDVEIEMLMLTTPLQRHDQFLQMALESYFLEDIKYHKIMVYSYVHKITSHIPKWNKQAIVINVAYAIALSCNICNTTPLEATYSDLTPVIKEIMRLGSEPYTLDIANALADVDIDCACSVAIGKVLKLENNVKQTDN